MSEDFSHGPETSAGPKKYGDKDDIFEHFSLVYPGSADSDDQWYVFALRERTDTGNAIRYPERRSSGCRSKAADGKS